MPATRAQIASIHGPLRKMKWSSAREAMLHILPQRGAPHHRLTGIWVTGRTWGEQQPRCRAKLPDSRTSFRTTRTSGLLNASRERCFSWNVNSGFVQM